MTSVAKEAQKRIPAPHTSTRQGLTSTQTQTQAPSVAKEAPERPSGMHGPPSHTAGSDPDPAGSARRTRRPVPWRGGPREGCTQHETGNTRSDSSDFTSFTEMDGVCYVSGWVHPSLQARLDAPLPTGSELHGPPRTPPHGSVWAHRPTPRAQVVSTN